MSKIPKTLTMEKIILVACLIIGAFFRLVNLSSMPLSDSEAGLANHSLQLLMGSEPSAGIDQVFLANFQAILFYIFGTGNFIARLIPAFVGILFISLPFVFRKLFSPGVKIILSFWIAVSPTFIALSRQINSSIILLFSLSLFIIFFYRKKPFLSALFLVIALLSGKMFFLVILPIFVAGIFFFLYQSRNTDQNITLTLSSIKNFSWQPFLVSLAFLYPILSTAFFIFPQHFSGAGYALNGFFDAWNIDTLLRLDEISRNILFYEAAALLLGIPGLRLVWRKRPALGILILTLVLVSLVEILLTETNIVEISMLFVISLTVSGAFFISNLFYRRMGNSSKVIWLTLAAFSIAVFITLALLNLTRNAPLEESNVFKFLLVLAGFILVSGALILAGWVMGWKVAAESYQIVSLLVLLLFTLSAASGAARFRTPNENEILQLGKIPREANLLVSILKSYSQWKNGDRYSLDVIVLGSHSESLAWALRDFENVRYQEIVPLDRNPDVIISRDDYLLENSDQYSGELIQWHKDVSWKSINLRDSIQWFFTRRIPQSAYNTYGYIVWVNHNLMPGLQTNQ